MWEIGELKAKGKAAMKENYGMTLLATIILGATTAGYSSTAGTNSQQISEKVSQDPEVVKILMAVLAILGVMIIIVKLVDILVFNPLEVGCKYFFLKNTEEPAQLDSLGRAFKPSWMNNVTTLLLRDIFLVLWTMLFIIPGFVKAYSYRLVPFIQAEHPEMSGTQAITEARRLMNGHKWRAFCLDLSFFGWFLLSILTCGILAVFYVNPYYYCTEAELYKAIRDGSPAE